MRLSKEAKVGLLALVAGVILYLGFNFLKGYEVFSSTNKYYIVYNDIKGLTVSNPVMVNGLTVGRVAKIDLLTNKQNKLLVTIDVQNDVKVGNDTKAVLANTDLLGSKSIDLKIGNNTTLYEDGATLKGEVEKELTEVLAAKAMPIMTNLDSTIVKLNQIFGDELGKSIGTTLHNFELASAGLNTIIAANQKNILAVTTNLAELSASLEQTEKQLKPVIAKLDNLADSLNNMELKQTVRNANDALKNVETITAKINQGEGSLGQLVNDKELYQNLNKASGNINKLLEDIQKNPKRYVRISVF